MIKPTDKALRLLIDGLTRVVFQGPRALSFRGVFATLLLMFAPAVELQLIRLSSPNLTADPVTYTIPFAVLDQLAELSFGAQLVM